MKKNTLYILSTLISILLINCKRDPNPSKTIDSYNQLHNERYKTISSHYWRLAEIWQDTTSIGLSHPELIPLSTSTQVYTPIDSCQFYASSKYAQDGWYYSVKKNGCGGCSLSCCETFENIHWGISVDGQTFYGASSNIKIIVVNDSLFKHYDIGIYNFTIKTITVRIYKAIVYQ